MRAEIDEKVQSFLNRPLEGDWPYLWLDATSVKVREAGRIVSKAVIVAVAVNTDGRREVLGLAIGPSESEAFWTDFLRGLMRRRRPGARALRIGCWAGFSMDRPARATCLPRLPLRGTR